MIMMMMMSSEPDEERRCVTIIVVVVRPSPIHPIAGSTISLGDTNEGVEKNVVVVSLSLPATLTAA